MLLFQRMARGLDANDWVEVEIWSSELMLSMAPFKFPRPIGLRRFLHPEDLSRLTRNQSQRETFRILNKAHKNQRPILFQYGKRQMNRRQPYNWGIPVKRGLNGYTTDWVRTSESYEKLTSTVQQPGVRRAVTIWQQGVSFKNRQLPYVT